MITYLIGDATYPEYKKNEIRILLHICNREGKWGKGFVICLFKRWKEPEAEYRKWFRDHTLTTGKSQLPLGAIQIVQVFDEFGELFVINMIAQEGFMCNSNPVPLRYSALVACLNEVKKWINEKRQVDKDKVYTISMPRIGSKLAGGDWKEIEKIINLCLKDEHIIVYDLK